jgi:hypothetical protein
LYYLCSTTGQNGGLSKNLFGTIGVCQSRFRRQYFLNADLVNQVISSQIRQMGSFLVIRQICTDAVDHHHDERAIVHVHPVRAADKFIRGVSNERAINILAQVGLIKVRHNVWSFDLTASRSLCVLEAGRNSRASRREIT